MCRESGHELGLGKLILGLGVARSCRQRLCISESYIKNRQRQITKWMSNVKRGNHLFKLDNVVVKNIITIKELTIEGQAVTCIVGQSGSGKSTFIRLLNNLDNPSSGDIYYRDTIFREIDPIILRRQITMVPQTPVTFEGTVRANLEIGLKFSEKELATDARMNEVLDMMDLDKNLEDDAEDLSGGEKQRVALARVILLDADVFLLDEPTSALDDATASKVIEKFVDYGKVNNKTIIMVTHDTELADKIADQIIHMDHYSDAIQPKENDHE